MIAWWGWLLIWTGLVLGLLAMLAAFAWWLFRKSLVLLDDVSNLAEKSAILEVDDPQLVRPQIAVLAQLSDIRARENARKEHRAARRNDRRQARIDRGRRITSVDATRETWPEDWGTRSQRPTG